MADTPVPVRVAYFCKTRWGAHAEFVEFFTRVCFSPRTPTIQLYESGPAVKLGTSHLISTQAGLTDPRIVDGIEQRSFLYGLLLEGQGWMGGCAGGPIRFRVVKRPAG
jgi:hypothetical protein